MKHKKRSNTSVDEYLEEMYRCELNGRASTTKGISMALRISMPSVSEMLGKLERSGLVINSARGEKRLTSKGRKEGESVYKKHETLKKLLLRIGLPEKDATDEACRLEHNLSDKALVVLEGFLERCKGRCSVK